MMKCKSRQFFIIIFCLMIFLSSAHAQHKFTGKISGRIVDEKTEQPVYLTNIFLANTTLGTTSNQKGFFQIKNIPFGTYELIISMMGYELQKINIKIADSKNQTFQIKLKSKVLKGERVTVTAKVPEEWLKNLKIFKRILFGIKEIAKECDIKNPEIINFDYNKSTGIFKAFTDSPVILINNALGYEITFIMERFEAQLFDDDIYKIEQIQNDIQRFNKGAIEYIGSVGFKELPYKNKRQVEKWRKNRLIAYNGSRRHFLRSLCSNRLKKEGFEIRIATQFRSSYENKIKVKQILKKIDNSTFSLSFPNFLKVRYKKERDDIKYKRRLSFLEKNSRSFEQFENKEWQLAVECNHQDSYVKIVKGNSVIFDKNGTIIKGGALLEVAQGYWQWDSFAEILPNDYFPSK